jgi:hypothetical protein
VISTIVVFLHKNNKIIAMDYYGVHFQYISNIESTIINDILSSELGEVGFESFEEKGMDFLPISPAIYIIRNF